MPSTREMRMRIQSVKNLSQVTKALETVSASKVRRAMQKVEATRPYAEKAWKLLLHIARQPGAGSLHPLLHGHGEVKRQLVLVVSGSRGLAGAYNVNVLRYVLHEFGSSPLHVSYATVGRKVRDTLLRRQHRYKDDPNRNQHVEFDLPFPPDNPAFKDIRDIGQLLVEKFRTGEYDEVYIVYTHFRTMLHQEPRKIRLLPLTVEFFQQDQHGLSGTHPTHSVFTYEPGPEELLDEVITRFTILQVYQAILSAMASEHAARMVAMRNATENASELISALQMEYNKVRQNMITNDILDIVGGAEAQATGAD